MKSKILAYSILLILPCICFAQKKTDEQKNKILAIQKLEYLMSNTKIDQLVGKVKKVESLVYLADLSFGETRKKELIYKSSKTYNENGFLLHETRYTINSANATVFAEVNYIYNEKEELTSIVVLEPNGDLKSKTILKYDINGNMVERAGYDASGAFNYSGKSTYNYDSNGNLVEERSYDPSGKASGHRILIYNEKGYLISDEQNSDGYIGKELFKYDEFGNKVEKVDYYDGLFGVKIIYKYDEKGRLDSEKHYDEKGGLSVMSPQCFRKYDEAGNVIEITNNSYNNTFNDKTRNEYTYDDNLNWIKCISFTQYLSDLEKPDRITERVIIYHQ